MIEWKDLTSGVLFLLQIIFVVVAAIKVVTKIESTTALLQLALEHLRDSIDTLAQTVTKLDDRSDDHHDRILRLEETTKHRTTAQKR